MKVLFIIPTLGAGGAEKALTEIVNSYCKNNHEICVLTLFNKGKYIEKLNKNINYRFIFKNVFKGNIHILKLFTPKFLYKQFVKEYYDVIISFLEGPTTRIVSGCPYNKTKIINWVHTSSNNKKVFLAPYRNYKEFLRCYLKYDKTIFVAESAKNQFFNMFPKLNGIKSSVMYNPINSKYILEKANIPLKNCLSKNCFNIISVGRLSQVKGFERLIEACCRIRNEDNYKIHLYIIGNGEERKNLEKTIIRYNGNNCVTLMGFKENPYNYMANSDLYVCSSFREGYSTAVIEALILGIPVVTTLCSGMKEILGDKSKCGLITDNSYEGIYYGIKRIISNAEIYKEMKLNAKDRGRALSKLNSISTIGMKLEEIIEG